jgi:hypothetical protein
MYMYPNEYLRVLLVTISTTNDYENIIQNLYTQYLYAISKVKYIIKSQLFHIEVHTMQKNSECFKLIVG